MIGRLLANVEMMQVINCPAYSTSLHPVRLSLSCGGSNERYERSGWVRTGCMGSSTRDVRRMLVRGLAGGARRKRNDCRCSQIKIPMTFSTRKIDVATSQIPSHSQGEPLGSPVRGHHLAVPSTKVRQNPPDPLSEGGLQLCRHWADDVEDLRR